MAKKGMKRPQIHKGPAKNDGFVPQLQGKQKTGKEKKVQQSVLVKGASTEDATKVFHNGMKGTMAVYEIHTVSETQYMDVFFYSLDKVSDETR